MEKYEEETLKPIFDWAERFDKRQLQHPEDETYYKLSRSEFEIIRKYLNQ